VNRISNKSALKAINYIIASLSLLATPTLLFLSTSLPLFLNNQIDLDFQLGVLNPFILLFLTTFGIGILCWIAARRKVFRILLWTYFLTGPFFLLFTALRNTPIPVLENLIGITGFIVISLVLTIFITRKMAPQRATSFFVLLGALFITADGYRFFSQVDWDQLLFKNQNVNRISHVLNTDSDKPNVYHIILDGFQSDIFNSILTDEVRSQLNGFMSFTEASAVYSLTTWSVPSVMLGETYDFSMSHIEYQNRALNSENSILYGLKQAGYQNTAYTRKLYPFKFKYFDLTIPHSENLEDRPSFEREFISMWTYRFLPKAIILNLSRHGWLIDSVDIESFKRNTFLPDSAPQESYISFQEFLRREKLRESFGNYHFLHLLLPHDPYVFNSKCDVSKDADVISQSQCAIRMMVELIKELKNLNRYNKSLIIIHGDHGDRLKSIDGQLQPIKHRSHRTLLLVKPGSYGPTSDLVFSNAEATLLDVAPTILAFVKQQLPMSMEGRSLLGPGDLKEKRIGQRNYFIPSGSGNSMQRYIINGSDLIFSEKLIISNTDSSMIFGDDADSHTAANINQLIEAEDGLLSEGVVIKTNLPDTSNSYVVNGSVGFKFNIEKDGRYQLRARVLTPIGNNNSSFLSIDGQQRHTWHMTISKQWLWQNATVEWQLSKGEHMVVLDYREPVYFDQVKLVEVADSLKTSTDDSYQTAMEVNQVLEAENGLLSPSANVERDLPNSSESYVVNGSIGFKFNIQEDAKYQLRARLQTPSGKNNSSFLSIDGKQKHTWHMRISKQWLWQNATIVWQLSKGEHMVVLDNREPFYIDQIELVKVVDSIATLPGKN
jgi:hypothetical protein